MTKFIKKIEKCKNRFHIFSSLQEVWRFFSLDPERADPDTHPRRPRHTGEENTGLFSSWRRAADESASWSARQPGSSRPVHAPSVYSSSAGRACTTGQPARARGPPVLFCSARQVAGGLSVHALHVHCEEGEARGLLLGLADGALEMWGAARRW